MALSGMSNEKAPVPRGAIAISTSALVVPEGVTSNRSLGEQVVLSRIKLKPPAPASLQTGSFEEETHLTAGFCGLSNITDIRKLFKSY